ncbi:MAG TPA: Hpt domain-containing protein [Opitutaceae bacterium]|jgi:HPt (histidine-containing phosphotransfer) domain-containing protein|nr:Hpt domain-containing protein [Opitutaceae bacterium]
MNPPNERLAALIQVLGVEETRELVRIFLRTAPKLVSDIGQENRAEARRAAHSLKSSSSQMGLADLSKQALEIEKRFDAGGPPPSAMELTLLQARVRRAEAALRDFAGPDNSPPAAL